MSYQRNQQWLHCTAILVALSLLSACGFQLRGVGGTALPETWKTLYLVTDDPNGEFTQAVVTQFAANGVQWATTDSAGFNIVLSPESFNQRNLSLNSEARVSEFELTMSAKFRVLDTTQQQLMPLTTVSVVKQMENDPRNEVGKEGELRLLQSEMRSELADQIMRRIGYFAIGLQLRSESASASDSETTSKPERAAR